MAANAPATLGTTTPIRLAKERGGAPLLPDGGYFRIRIAAAQAAVFGPMWQRANGLVVTSEVTLNCAPFGTEPQKAIQRVREVERGTATQLGLASDLVGLTPAFMERITLSVDFLLDTRNRFATLAELANSDAFLSVVSLAPGAAAVAKQVTGLTNKVISTFSEPQGQTPLLSFTADLNLVLDDLSDGYYVIFGSPYEKHPLPRPLPSADSLTLRDGDLLHDGRPVTQWSYVVFEVDTVRERGRTFGRGEPWHDLWRLADARAESLARNPFARSDERGQVWAECDALLRKVDVLLHESPLYLDSEKRDILRATYADLASRVFPPDASLGAPPELPTSTADLLGLSGPSELAAVADRYRAAEADAEAKLRGLGLLP